MKTLMVITRKSVMAPKAKAAETTFWVAEVTSWQHWITSAIRKEENL